VEEEPLPLDPNGFAVKVENDSSFIAIDEDGYFSFINVRELPADSEVPLNRFVKEKLGRIIALLPFDIEANRHCTLISRLGTLKKFNISEMKPSRRPCIELKKGDKLVKGIVSRKGTGRDILVYTDQGYGQRLDPNLIRVTSYQAKGLSGFKLAPGDQIIGCFLIDPRNQHLLYLTSRGKGRLNLTEYLPMRDSKHDEMVRLITLPDRDHLLAVIGCDRLDKIQVFYQDHSDEVVEISSIPEGTMSSPPVKIVKASMTSSRIIKVKIL
jgi:DNA gyrase/topoisomerase IV subunit A